MQENQEQSTVLYKYPKYSCPLQGLHILENYIVPRQIQMLGSCWTDSQIEDASQATLLSRPVQDLRDTHMLL